MPATIPIKRAALVYAPHETVADVSREIAALIAGGLAVMLTDGQSLDRGDLLAVGADATMVSVPLGRSGAFVQSDGFDVTWSPWSFVSNDFVKGDLIIFTLAQEAGRLAVGSSSPAQVLGVSAGLPAWRTASTYLAHNLLSATHSDTLAASVAAGAMIYGNVSLQWARLAAPLENEAAVLTGSTAFPAWLATSTVGALLMSTGTAESWATTLTGNYTFSAAGTALTVTNNALISGNLTVSGYAQIGASAPAGYTSAGDGVIGSSSRYLAFDESTGLLQILATATPVVRIGTTAAVGASTSILAVAGANTALYLECLNTSNANRRVCVVSVAGNNGRFLLYDSSATEAIDLNVNSAFVFNQQGADIDTRIEGDTNTVLWVADAGLDQVSTTYGGTRASAAGATWNAVYWKAGTATITGSTNITTATGFNAFTIEAPTLSAASALTVTNAATVYLAGPPVGGGAGPATITNPYTLWVDAGNVRIDAGLIVGGTALTAGFILDVTGDLRVSSGLNVGGTTAPADGKAIITTSLAVGGTAVATYVLDVTGKAYVSDELEIDGAFNHDGSTFGVYGVMPVARPAAYTITNDTSDRTLDADTLVVSELADVVATVIRDLASQGLLQVA